MRAAAHALREVIQYPVLYRDSFQRLGVECPKGGCVT
jgi:ATP-dependent 26S proteasome regulatory subunit